MSDKLRVALLGASVAMVAALQASEDFMLVECPVPVYPVNKELRPSSMERRRNKSDRKRNRANRWR